MNHLFKYFCRISILLVIVLILSSHHCQSYPSAIPLPGYNINVSKTVDLDSIAKEDSLKKVKAFLNYGWSHSTLYSVIPHYGFIFGGYTGYRLSLTSTYTIRRADFLFYSGFSYMDMSTPYKKPKENAYNSIPIDTTDSKSDIHVQAFSFTPIGVFFPFRLSQEFWIMPSADLSIQTLIGGDTKRIPEQSGTLGISLGVASTYFFTKTIGLGAEYKLNLISPLRGNGVVDYPGTLMSLNFNLCVLLYTNVRAHLH